MFVAGLPSAATSTNCWVLAPDRGEQCVVVDPGIDIEGRLDALLEQHRLQPVAVLLTHGHLDHTFSVTPVCGARGIPAYIHSDDAELLVDPTKALSAEFIQLISPLAWTEPEDVRPMRDGEVLQLAGLELTVDHAPGHTRGCVLFSLPGEEHPTCLSGDVLFAGSIGRTDLPGGDHDAMLRSLATKVLPLADHTVVLPGHGPQTTIGRERATNPYLQGLHAPGDPGPAMIAPPSTLGL